MLELHTVVAFMVFVLCQNTVCGCEVLGRFDMPSLFRQGDIMIGGIFPVFNKEIITTFEFENKPAGVMCTG